MVTLTSKQTNLALVLVLAVLMMVGSSKAQNQRIRVATKPTPPFAIKNGNTWDGFTFKLFEQHVLPLLSNFSSTLEPTVLEFTSNDEIFDALNTGAADIGLAAPTITATREQIVDFSHSFFDSGLQIMVKKQQSNGAQAVVDYIFGQRFLLVVLAMITGILCLACIIWLLEVYKTPGNTSFFEANPKKGIPEAMKWITLSLLAKPTKVPRHPFSNAMSAILSFVSIIVVAFVTASITVALSLQASSSDISKLSDLAGRKVGSVNGSAPYNYLKSQSGIIVEGASSLSQMFDNFHNNSYAAVVYDFPILRFHVKEREANGSFDTVIVGEVFNKQTYGFVMPNSANKQFEEEVNRGLLRVMYTSAYFSIFDEYFKVSERATSGSSDGFVIDGGQIAGLIVTAAIVVGVTYYLYKKWGNPDVENEVLDEDLDKQLADLDFDSLQHGDNFLMNFEILRSIETLQEWVFRLNNKEAYFRDEFYTTEDMKMLVLNEKMATSELLRRRQKHQTLHRDFTQQGLDTALRRGSEHVRVHHAPINIVQHQDSGAEIALEIPNDNVSDSE